MVFIPKWFSEQMVFVFIVTADSGVTFSELAPNQLLPLII
jgi:hypothetical protein